MIDFMKDWSPCITVHINAVGSGFGIMLCIGIQDNWLPQNIYCYSRIITTNCTFQVASFALFGQDFKWKYRRTAESGAALVVGFIMTLKQVFLNDSMETINKSAEDKKSHSFTFHRIFISWNRWHECHILHKGIYCLTQKCLELLDFNHNMG